MEKGHDTSLPEKPTAADLLASLKLAQGKYFIGYKGGDFTMDKTTPVWVANYGSSSGFKENEHYHSQAAVGVSQRDDRVVIETALKSY
jgi:hypothetical protein